MKNITKFFKNKTNPDEQRILFVNRIQPEEFGEPIILPKYSDNRIKTSKYKIYTFPFKNLFEQFRRIANFYFLIVGIIQVFIDSPVSPVTSILPLIFVIGVTAIKQGYEDWRRHVEDNKVNNVPARILSDGEFIQVRTKDIVVGDIVEVSVEEQFPCDLLLIMSSDPEAKCDVTTANLDGETNLKSFLCPDGTQHLETAKDLWNFRAVVECETPHAKLYDFKGRLDVYRGNSDPAKSSLSTENLLLRGARLKNTTKAYGVAVYTGEETKMALNTKMTNNKFSTVETTMNYFLIFFLIVLFIEVLVCTVLKYQLYSLTIEDDMWYIPNKNFTINGATTKDIIQDSFSFLVIFNYIIPISLYVTLEVQKFLGILFFEWDDEIKCADTGERAKANTSDLNEELGQVQYLFTDKTGTLTENIMFFRHCSVEGVKYINVEDNIQILDEYNSTTQPLPTLPSDLDTFLQTLALCHTVRVGRPSAKDEVVQTPDGCEMSKIMFEYQAASPDEKALVEACASFGVIFDKQVGNQLTLDVRGSKRTFTRLQVLEFDSDRKCMSVVVKEASTGRLWLLTKGAESSVLKKCLMETTQHQQTHQLTNKHINDYAMLGLRTLAVARRELTPNLYEDYSQQLDQARQKLEGREEAVLEVMNRMEADLTLLGATGVEDLLQDGVQETLESLRVAGIKVWVLTGDKVETAVNIAYSCGHFKRFMTVLYLTGLGDADSASAALKKCDDDSQGDAHYGLVVDGASLQILLDNMKEEFYKVCTRCTAVVCCRMSPRQKAETVRLVKKSSERPVCAAIGDGANDVSMIQEAHIGLGIMGKEGRQAVRCADFAFARFRFLKRVLLVHGHWYYVRVSTLVQYSFYKNVAFITPQIFFAIWNAFSTQSVYESLGLTMYNITFTSLPVLIYGIFDQNLPPEILMSYPYLYQRNTKNAAMSWSMFFKWTAFALWHTLVMYFGLMIVWQVDKPTLPDGQDVDLYLFGTALLNLCVYVVNIKLMLEARYYTHFFFWSVVLTLVFYAALNLLYQGIIVELFDNYEIYWSYYRMHESGWIMLTSVLLGVVCLIPDLLNTVYLSFPDKKLLERFRATTMATSPDYQMKLLGYTNWSFDPVEGGRSIWETTKKQQPPSSADRNSNTVNNNHNNELQESRHQPIIERGGGGGGGGGAPELSKQMSFDRQTVSTGRASIKSDGSLEHDWEGGHQRSSSQSESWQGASVII